MARFGVLASSAVLVLASSAVAGQTTAGTSATIVVPVIAQTASFASEVTLYNPNAASIDVNGVFYDAQNTAAPGPKACTSLAVGSNVSKAFTVATQCALPSGSNFGLLVLSESTGTNRFYGYARTQTPQGIGFSTEGFPIENFNDQIQHATGLKRVAAAGGLPAYQTNCFVATLGDAVSYELRLFDGATNTQLGSTVSGSLAAFEQYRFLDVFAAAGVPAGNKTNVRAQFTNLTGNNKKLIGFCTVQENTNLSADFRIAKSYGGTPQNAFVQGGNAFGTTALLGTVDNQPLTLSANGQPVMRYFPNEIGANSPNIVGGHPNNGAAGGANWGQTIAGGGFAGATCYDPPTATNARSCGNQTTATFATIGGGVANVADLSSFVGGGESNTASGDHAMVGGGGSNTASFTHATVAGGYLNQSVGDYAFVGGGNGNDAVSYGTVGGGQTNQAGNWAVAAGGLDNNAPENYSTVSGGQSNSASASHAVVGGGLSNTATGIQSTVPGGLQNWADGSYSFAAGADAFARAVGQFVWSDASGFTFDPTFGPGGWAGNGDNTFNVRATGGVWFLTGVDASGNPVNGQGVEVLAHNGAWTTYSDRNGKDRIEPVDPRAVLEKLLAVPVATWKWKGEDERFRHMGPMAQDFYAAFGLGADDRHIVTVDEEGVALAAIQGLHQVMQEKDVQIQAQQRRIAELEARMNQVETLRGELDEMKRAVSQLTQNGGAVAMRITQ